MKRIKIDFVSPSIVARGPYIVMDIPTELTADSSNDRRPSDESSNDYNDLEELTITNHTQRNLLEDG